MHELHAGDRAEADLLATEEAEGRISSIEYRAAAVDADTAIAAARESDERLRLLSDNLPDSALFQFTREADGTPRFLYVSAGIEGLTGIRPEDALRDAGLVLGQVPIEQQTMRFEAEAKSVRELSDFDLELQFRRADGELRWKRIKARPRRSPDGRVIWDGVQTDVTERRRIEEAMHQSEQRLKLAAQTAGFGVHDYDPVADRAYWSEELYAIAGIAAGTEIRGDTSISQLHPDDRGWVVDAIREALDPAGSGLFAEEFRIVRTDTGETRWLYNRAQTMFEERDGRQTAIRNVGVILDITDRKRNEQTLKEVTRRKDEFLAMLAHELRNPLAPIRNAAQLLRLRGPGEPPLESAHATIERQLSHLVRLVDDLLDVARVSRGRITLKTGPLDLNEVIRQTVETSQALLDARGQTLTVTLPPGPVHVEGDFTRLAQVAHNLLSNAARYTDRGGRIELTLARTGHDEGAEAVLRVRDSGVGLDPTALRSVFDLFYQVDRDLDRSEGGMGIGLSLVKNLVELHGGQVEAHSKGLGHGSEFVVRLPASPLPEARTALRSERPAAPTKAPRGLRILVVDDNFDAAETMAMLLELEGHDVQIAHDGQEAVTIALAERPDVVLLDIGLPKLNGYEACKAMRQGGLTGALIIATTGYGQEEDRRLSRQAGFDSHQLKPVQLSLIHELLAKHAAAIESA